MIEESNAVIASEGESLELVIERFERAWNCGSRPAMRRYVPPRAHPDRRRWVIELVETELEYRLKAGDQAPLVEMYFQLYPEELGDPEVALRLIAAEYKGRWLREPGVTRAEYQEHFPHYSEQLQAQLKPEWKCPACPEPPTLKLEDERVETVTCPSCNREFPVRSRPAESLPPVGGYSAGQPPNADWPKISGYTVVEELGRGGMGVVYKAWEHDARRWVALKMVLAGLHAAPEDLARFRREAKTVGPLEHPSIVGLYNADEHNGELYFAFQFVDGGSLAKKLAGTPQSPREAAKLVETLARAMHYAHQHDVVHRDLKPSNVLLTSDGVPKISDFGLAKRLDMKSGETRTRQVIGTPSYMAPEQAEGKAREVGPAADVYALGAILYECLTGRPPFNAATALDTLLQVRTQEPVAPTRLVRHVPRDLETICLKCLQKDPCKRYASAEELAEDLRRFLAGEPIKARPVGPIEKSWRWCRRYPAAASLIAVLVVSIIGAMGLANWALRALKETRRESSKRALEQSQTLFDNKDLGRGLVWLARSLEDATAAEDAGLEHTIRTALSGWRSQIHSLRGVFSHEEQVTDVAFSPDGRLIATGSLDRTARLWDATTGAFRGRPLAHADRVDGVTFSPNSKALLTWSGNTARLWDVAAGEGLGAPLGHKGKVHAATLSRDGRLVATGCEEGKGWLGDEGTARLWDAATGRPVGAVLAHESPVRYLAFTPDGKTLLTGSEQGAQLWDVTTGKKMRSIKMGSLPQPTYMAFSPDSKKVLTNRSGRELRLWDLVTGKLVREWPDQETAFTALAYSPDSRTLLTASTDNTARLCDAETGKAIGEPLVHQEPVVAAAYSPDGKMVVTGSFDHIARLWDVATTKAVGCPLLHRHIVAGVAFSPDGRTVLTRSHNTARLWEVAHNGPAGLSLQRAPDAAGISSASFSPDGKQIVIGGEDETARFYSTQTGEPLSEHLRHKGSVSCVTFCPDGRLVATASEDKTVRLWESASGKPVGPPIPHEDSVGGVVFSPDGKVLLTYSGREARLWDAITQRPVGGPLVHQARVLAAVFSPDGRLIATGGEDGTAHLWHSSTGNPATIPLLHRGRVQALAFSPDGKILLAGCGDPHARTGEARLWKTTSGSPGGEVLLHQNEVTCVAFSPDGKYVLTGSVDTTARLWDAASGAAVHRPLQHKDLVAAVAFSPDSQIALTGSGNGLLPARGAAQLWSVTTGKPLGPPLDHDGLVKVVAFSSDGRTVLTGDTEGTVRLTPVPIPMAGGIEQIGVWTQIITGLELDRDGAIHVLGAPRWDILNQRLQELGGPPP